MKKVLIATTRAQNITVVGVLIHFYPWSIDGLKASKIFADNGGDIKKYTYAV